MTLTDLLKIDQTRVGARHAPGLRFAERLWMDAGKPTEAGPLADFIESVLSRCGKLQITYPPILLKRKKQVERGEFRLEPVDRAGAAASVQSVAPGVCSKCGGVGHHAGRFSSSLCMTCLGTGLARPGGQ